MASFYEVEIFLKPPADMALRIHILTQVEGYLEAGYHEGYIPEDFLVQIF